jgi:hypothetical protein
VVAVSSQFVSGVAPVSTVPGIVAARAERLAQFVLPDGRVGMPSRLVVLPTVDPVLGSAEARLAWEVELLDAAAPARVRCYVDARDGALLEVTDLIAEGRDRLTYSADHRQTIPGILVRDEGSQASGDRDVDLAHRNAGLTYDYFSETYGRDSYDGGGASLVSTVHYGRSYYNAFWNGEQTVYGDGFPVLDVVAHEWSHAVTEYTAALVYEWQSGALNESFSDVFGAMVDRDDWLMGDELPSYLLAGRPGLRDLAHPPALGQPDHADDWVETCSDNEGVHTNSGIPNKAFYRIATQITKGKAERIFYRALAYYLGSGATLSDLRLAALQSAEDLYGASGSEAAVVRQGFDAVGIDGVWEPEPNDCTCGFTTLLGDRNQFADPMTALEIASTLYRVRDEILPTTDAGQYYRDFFYSHTAAISAALRGDESLRALGGDLLRASASGFVALAEGRGEEVTVSVSMVEAAAALLEGLAASDRAHGDGVLAAAIDDELELIDLDDLSGLTFAAAWQYLADRHAGDAPLAGDGRAGGPFPIALVAGSGGDDETAVDTDSAIAFDAVNGRFLVVWLSGRRLESSGDGFDVYGRFLDSSGAPQGSAFRISDTNNAAINAPPAVAAGAGRFLVTWTRKGSECAVVGQAVTDAAGARDFTVASGLTPMHSPAVAYSGKEKTFLIAYVAGSDYLPASLFGADTADCGDNSGSTSRIRAAAYRVAEGGLEPVSRIVVSGRSRGAFRPDVAYGRAQNQFLVVWEDRRNAGVNPRRFEVYGQRVSGTGSANRGDNFKVAGGGEYDTAAPWTPSPEVADGPDGYLVVYFERKAGTYGFEWMAKGRMIGVDGSPGRSITLTRMPFARDHSGDEPAGLLAVAFDGRIGEYLVVQGAHMESLWGYFPSVTALRVTPGGSVLDLNGKPRVAVGVGQSLDWSIDLQTAPAVAVHANTAGLPNFMVVYTKHQAGGHEKDLNIWLAEVRAS